MTAKKTAQAPEKRLLASASPARMPKKALNQDVHRPGAQPEAATPQDTRLLIASSRNTVSQPSWSLNMVVLILHNPGGFKTPGVPGLPCLRTSAIIRHYSLRFTLLWGAVNYVNGIQCRERATANIHTSNRNYCPD